MLTSTTTQLWELVVPYIRNRCEDVIEQYIKNESKRYEANLRNILEPQLGEIAVNITQSMDKYAKDVNVNIQLKLPEDKRGTNEI